MTDTRIVITADGAPATREIERVAGSMKTLPAAARTAQAGLDGMGMSAAQTAMAMRQVPMQITDIVTSLAAGQPAMMVFMQQGGQLKDMFGGIVPAGKALASTVAGMVNPLTLAAGAAAAAGVAWYQATQEAEAFEKSLIMSGNAIGLTSDNLKTIATEVGQATGAYGESAAALAEMAGSSLIASRDVGLLTEAAVRLEEISGQKIGETRKQFEELARSPLEALLKLNDGTNFLTTSLFDQVKALEEQGKKTEAAEVAQRGYASAMIGRADQVVESTNKLVRGWDAVAASAAAAWRTMVRQFDDKTLTDKIGEIDRQIAALEGRDKNRASRTGGLLGSLLGDDPRQLESLRAQRDALLETQRLAERVAQTRAEASAKERAAIEQRAADLKKQREEEEKNRRAAEAAAKNELRNLEQLKKSREELEKLINKKEADDDQRQENEALQERIRLARLNNDLFDEEFEKRERERLGLERGIKSAREMVSAIQFETETLRMSNAEREFAIEMRKLEAMGLEQGTEAWNAYAEALRGAIDERAQVRAGIESAREFEQTWQRTSNQVGQAFAYAIMEGGESAANYVKRLFGTLVLQPGVNAVVNPVTQGVTSALSGGGSGGLSLASGIGSLGSLGSFAATGFMNTVAGSGMMSGLSAAGSLMQGGSVMSGLGMGLGAVAPYLLAAAAVYAILSRDGGGPKTGGSYVSDGSRLFTPADQDTVAAQFADSLYSGYQQAVQKLGGTAASLAYGIGFDMDPQGDAASRVSTTLGSYSAIDVEAGRSEEELAAGVALATQRAILAGLQQSDLPSQIAGVLDDVSAASASAEQIASVIQAAEAMRLLLDAAGTLGVPLENVTQAMINAAGGADALAAGMATYYENFYTEEERLAKSTADLAEQFAAIGIAMPPTREEFRVLAETLREMDGSDAQAAYGAVMAMSGAFASITPPLQAATNAADDFGTAVQQTAAEIASAASSLGGIRALMTDQQYVQRLAPLVADDWQTFVVDALGAGASQFATVQAGMPTTKEGLLAVYDEINAIYPEVAKTIEEKFLPGFLDLDQTISDIAEAATRAAQTTSRATTSVTRSVNAAADAMRTSMQSVADFVQSLYVGDLAIGSPQEQLQYAAALYQSTVASAPTSAEAMGRLPGVAQQFLTLQQGFSGATTGYADVYRQVLADLERLIGRTGPATRTEDLQREQLTETKRTRKLSERQLTATQRAASRPSYAY